jgi:hypothetical protein
LENVRVERRLKGRWRRLMNTSEERPSVHLWEKAEEHREFEKVEGKTARLRKKLRPATKGSSYFP